MQVAAGLDHLLVSAGAWIVLRWESRFRSGAFRIEAEIPRLPVVDVRPGLVENDSRITDDHAGKAIPQGCREHGPLATVRMTNDADALGIHLRPIRQGMPAVGRN